jgi:uncharacterized protein (DUF433 family)
MQNDPRNIAAYGITEAAYYLRVPVGTIRSWIFGQPYQTLREHKRSKPVVRMPDNKKAMLSFSNLVEMHILDAIRSEHQIPLQKIRPAIDYLEKEFKSEHPLIDHKFETDGLELFIEKYGKLINISRSGQIEMKEIIKAYLKRIEYDEKGLVAKLFPFTRKRHLDDPKLIVIDPFISFGRPVVAGTGISTTIIAERYKAGESTDELAGDYHLSKYEIEEAIRCELQIKAA